MYTKLLEETIREMKGERIEEEVETSMNLGVDIYIPKNYIGDENLRMTFYKKIASAATDQRLEDIRNEMRDRFGAVPGEHRQPPPLRQGEALRAVSSASSRSCAKARAAS